MHSSPPSNQFFSRQNWSVTKALIAFNILIFLLGLFIQVPSRLFGYVSLPQALGAYSVHDVLDKHEWWRLLTYQFVHANLGHLAFNMFALWIFGRLMETILGKGRFLIFYLLCGIAGALFSSLVASTGIFDKEGLLSLWRFIPMVGASGSIYGILAAAAALFPQQRIQLLFPPVELSLRTFALALLGIGISFILFNWANAGGEAGHIGGMIMGFILIQFPFFHRRPARRQNYPFS